MKNLLALLFIVLMGLSSQTYALCLYITDTYSGILEPFSEAAVYGPFTITSANGCSGATIDVNASTQGSGRAPWLIIQKQSGGSWVDVAGIAGSNTSYSGEFGTYRVFLINDQAQAKSYLGTTRYGR